MTVQTMVALLAAPLLVGASSVAARRWDERVGGIVSAFPAIVGPVLLISALEQGEVFTARLANGMLLGLVGLSGFVLVYGRAAARWPWWACLGLAWAVAVVLALAVGQVKAASPAGFAAAAASLIVAHHWLAPAPAVVAPSVEPAGIWARMVVTLVLVAALAAAAARFGPLVGGILAALPVLASILAVATHRLSGPLATLALLRGMLVGMVGFVAFCQLVALLIMPAGIVVAFACATVVALVAQALGSAAGASFNTDVRQPTPAGGRAGRPHGRRE